MNKSKLPQQTNPSFLEPVSRKFGNFSDPENCFVFVVFSFKTKVSFNNFENNTMKLSADEIKLNGLWDRNCVTIQQVLILKICLRAQKVSGSFEKRAPGSLTAYQPIQIIVTTNKSLCSFFLIPHLFLHPAKP